MWLAILILVFVVALAGNSLHGDGWFWAIGNATGLVAFSQLLILVSNGRSGLGRSIRHRWLGLVRILRGDLPQSLVFAW